MVSFSRVALLSAVAVSALKVKPGPLIEDENDAVTSGCFGCRNAKAKGTKRSVDKAPKEPAKHAAQQQASVPTTSTQPQQKSLAQRQKEAENFAMFGLSPEAVSRYLWFGPDQVVRPQQNAAASVVGSTKNSVIGLGSVAGSVQVPMGSVGVPVYGSQAGSVSGEVATVNDEEATQEAEE